MAGIDNHVVRFHGVLDFIDDCLSCCLDSEHLSDFDDMIRRGLFADHTWRLLAKKNYDQYKWKTFSCHALLQSITFHQQFLVTFFSFGIIFILNVDDSSLNCGNTLSDKGYCDKPRANGHEIYLDHNCLQTSFQLSESIIFIFAVYINSESVFTRNDCDGLMTEIHKELKWKKEVR